MTDPVFFFVTGVFFASWHNAAWNEKNVFSSKPFLCQMEGMLIEGIGGALCDLSEDAIVPIT